MSDVLELETKSIKTNLNNQLNRFEEEFIAPVLNHIVE